MNKKGPFTYTYSSKNKNDPDPFEIFDQFFGKGKKKSKIDKISENPFFLIAVILLCLAGVVFVIVQLH